MAVQFVKIIQSVRRIHSYNVYNESQISYRTIIFSTNYVLLKPLGWVNHTKLKTSCKQECNNKDYNYLKRKTWVVTMTLYFKNALFFFPCVFWVFLKYFRAIVSCYFGCFLVLNVIKSVVEIEPYILKWPFYTESVCCCCCFREIKGKFGCENRSYS